MELGAARLDKVNIVDSIMTSCGRHLILQRVDMKRYVDVISICWLCALFFDISAKLETEYRFTSIK